MAGPSGYQEAFLVMERVGDRFKLIDAFPSGYLAEEDATQRYQDTGRDYSIAQFLADIQDIADIVGQLDVDVLSQVVNEPYKTLPVNGDDTNTTPQTVLGVPVARYTKNAENFVAWNLRAPLGGASGFQFVFRWMAEAAGNGQDINWELDFTNLPSGVTLDSQTPAASSGVTVSGPYTQRYIYEHNIPFFVDIGSLEAFSLSFKRQGGTDGFNQNTFLLSAAINYNPEAT
jgi:hypothetical protein